MSFPFPYKNPLPTLRERIEQRLGVLLKLETLARQVVGNCPIPGACPRQQAFFVGAPTPLLPGRWLARDGSTARKARLARPGPPPRRVRYPSQSAGPEKG